MAYRTQPLELPTNTDYQWLLNEAGKDGIKVMNLGTTGLDHGGPMYQFIGGNQGQIISLLTRIGVTPAQYDIEQFTP